MPRKTPATLTLAACLAGMRFAQAPVILGPIAPISRVAFIKIKSTKFARRDFAKHKATSPGRNITAAPMLIQLRARGACASGTPVAATMA